MNLPNKLTIGRIVAVPIFIVMYVMKLYYAAFALFILASVTDLFDGMLARKNNQVTNFGKIMDPLADKILVYSALCLFVQNGVIGAWMLIIILFREFIVSGIRIIASGDGKDVAAGFSGKVKTALQMVAVPLLILSQALPEITIISRIGYVIFILSLVMTVYSGVIYVMNSEDYFRS